MRSLGLDGALSIEAATLDLVETVSRIGPFGMGNKEPRFAITNARIVKADVVGANHVRAILGAVTGTGRLKSIAFRSAETPVGQALLTNQGNSLYLAGALRVDRWQGSERVQLLIDDVAPVTG